ncbi:MAG: glycosyltransferase, partial [Yaniella sp.]|nr:glycosyltransferase [Yaniella sp.]
MGTQLTIVMISMHTSPLARPGQGDAGGLNVYIRNLTEGLIRAGHQVLSFTRKTAATDHIVELDQVTGSKVIPLSVGRLSLPKEALDQLTAQFADDLVRGVEQYAKHPVVLHSHYWLSGMVAHQATLQLNAPIVHTMHTLG